MKVLVADDSNFYRNLLEKAVIKAGHEVVIVTSGLEAVEWYKNFKPDLVLLDVEMPGQDGFETARKIRELDSHKLVDLNEYWVPIIFLSQKIDEDSVDKGIKSGGDDYLAKPFAEKILIAKIFAMQRIVDIQRKMLEQKSAILHAEKIEMLGSISADVAHKIRNPLASIIQGGQSIARRFDVNVPANIKAAEECGIDINKINEYAQKRKIDQFIIGLRKAGTEAAEILSSLLQMTSDHASIKAKNNIIFILDKAISLLEEEHALSHQIEFKKIQVIKNYAKDLPNINCCATELEQAFYNILKNSAAAVTPLTTRAPTIEVEVTAFNDFVKIIIKDNGVGMDPEVTAKVFEPFYTTKKPGEGLGLGLTVTQSIINNKHDGDIMINSKLNSGTEVIMQLPIE